MFSGSIVRLNKIKSRIEQHISNLDPEILQYVVERAVYQFKLEAENGEQHVEHLFHKSPGIIKWSFHYCFLSEF